MQELLEQVRREGVAGKANGRTEEQQLVLLRPDLKGGAGRELRPRQVAYFS